MLNERLIVYIPIVCLAINGRAPESSGRMDAPRIEFETRINQSIESLTQPVRLECAYSFVRKDHWSTVIFFCVRFAHGDVPQRLL